MNDKRFKEKLIRVDIEFDELLNKIHEKRMKLNKEDFKHPMGNRRYTKAFARHPDINRIATDIIVANLEDDRKFKRRDLK